MAYADVSQVAAALDLPELARVATPAHAGDTTLVVDRPIDIPPGAMLLLGYGAIATETAQVEGPVSSEAIGLAAPLQHDWPATTRVLEITALSQVVEAASRMVDALTYTPAGGFEYAERNEIHEAIGDSSGNLLIVVDSTPVVDVMAVQYQMRPWTPDWSAPVQNLWWDDNGYIIRAYIADAVPVTPGSRVRTRVHYTGGYTSQTMPADIVRATAILAARLWKEKDSGYSDVIGSPEFGMLQYTQAAPKDVLAMLLPRRRVVAM